MRWEYIHALEEGWASVILARNFLDAMGYGYQVLFDTAAEQRVIVTDYVRPGHEL